MSKKPNKSAETVLLLSHLVQSPTKWRYGYELCKDTELKSGTLYPILIRLAELGLLEKKWVEPSAPGRPLRHMCRLTAVGKKEARLMISQAEASLPKWSKLTADQA